MTSSASSSMPTSARAPTVPEVDDQTRIDAMPPGVWLEYRLEEHLPLVRAAYRHVERWNVSVLLDRLAPHEGRMEIGNATLLVFNLEPDADIRDLTDPATGAWIDVDTAPGPSARFAEPDGGEGKLDSHLLLLDRVWLHPDYRGQGLGPIVAAAAIERLGRGCHLAACYPAPFEDATQDADDRAHAIAALDRIWAKVGFRHWRDGVWMIDLLGSDIHASLVELVNARSEDRGLAIGLTYVPS